MLSAEKLIHLLYVPTIYCNLGCTYCYLGEQTDQNMLKKDFGRALSTLEYGVNAFKRAGYTPFNISLHGGEVTTLPGHVLDDLFIYIRRYYDTQKDLLTKNGIKKTNPHIKTNLYNFDKHYDTMVEHKVSISASLDLPLSLHEKYRVTKKGKSTLDKTLNNIKLLAKYPYGKKLSAVIYEEHLHKIDDIIKDIWYLHREIGIDMNAFNFMFGFESQANDEKFIGTDNLVTKAVSDQAQVAFYKALRDEFVGTELEMGFHKHWFDEFTPSYCTNAFNCGEKFFLLQSDGNVFSCVRGQGSDPFHYGNIFTDEVETIIERASSNIAGVHRSVGLHDDCQQCEYLSTCHTGCAYVKHEQQKGKSYTCALQKEIYKNYPKLYPPTPLHDQREALTSYTLDMHPHLITSDREVKTDRLVLPNDLYEMGNSLEEMIRTDSVLAHLYGRDQVMLTVNGQRIFLKSQILKSHRDILTLGKGDEVALYVTDMFMKAACNDMPRNTLYLQLLRDTPVVYGDEQRTKQEHTFTLEVFYHQLKPSMEIEGYSYKLDLVPFLALSEGAFQSGVLNNLLVTSNYLRRYHYEKQKNNAFYHIQAINLPFQNIEFYWIKE
jgi:uncharacterized protein